MKLHRLAPVKTDKMDTNTIYYRRWTKFEKVFSVVGLLILFTGVGIVSDIIVVGMYLYCIDKVDVSPVGEPKKRLLIKKSEWDHYRREHGIDYWHQHQPAKVKAMVLNH
ncbi:hypothetical protein [Limosilactobacillus sp.]|uniref:hypothetical protein n=1 Tax=Limosilactobacillus sp. TaxID=2773925 RepID=UPI0025BF4DA6|nr:hypothetical protein [Limosilactobacillus sp.]MCH3922336.1 hypothetical protein [Limosilactobacillus sp.]MCH3929108.1 hypothetical protein [Limosilactobacillus sp.]